MKHDTLSPLVRAFAAADFTAIAERFSHARYEVNMPGQGILHLTPPDGRGRLKLLLSTGIHGDETAPVEMLASLLDTLSREPQTLQPDLMVVLGNPDAVAAGKRFIDTDLNRLFGALTAGSERSAEAKRAEVIKRAVAAFFAHADTEKWHFDLHTAIRPSHFPAFAVLPGVLPTSHARAMLGWLGVAGVEAVVLNPHPAGTFSAYTASGWDVASATVELGQVGLLGENGPERFAVAYKALEACLRRGEVEGVARLPKTFVVVQELVKHSAEFRLHFDRDVKNFTPFEPGTIIATDGDTVYRVGQQTEYVVFPNADVQVGLRAGLMVTSQGAV